MRRLLSLLLAFTLLITGFVTTGTVSFAQDSAEGLAQTFQEGKTGLDYVLFAGNPDSNLSINSSNVTISGDIHANDNFVFQGSKLTVSGVCESSGKIQAKGSKINIRSKLEEVPEIQMPDVNNEISSIASLNADYYNSNKSYSGKVITIPKSAIIAGQAMINGSEFNCDHYIIADQDININCASTKAGGNNKVVLCSKSGDITINGSNAVINGILYAPEGTVTVNAANFKLNGRIIANQIVIRGSKIDIAGEYDDKDLVYRESDIIFGEIAQQYDCSIPYELEFVVKDKDGNPVSEVECLITATGSITVPETVTTDENGIAKIAFSDNTEEIVTISISTKKGLCKSVQLLFRNVDPIGKVEPVTADNITLDPATGFYVANNQILITFKEEVSEDEIKEKVNSINGTIVGYINGLNDYQVRIDGSPSVEQLNDLKDLINNDPLVEAAILNWVIPTDQLVPDEDNDYQWFNSIEEDDVWDEANPFGRNWGLEAIYAPSAWDYNDLLSNIKVGVLDSCVMTNHEDLCIPEENFRYTANNIPVDDAMYKLHGTHVAGILGAKSNNDVGITGVLWKRDLYAFSLSEIPDGQLRNTSIFEVKYGILWLLEKECKVINLSQAIDYFRIGHYPSDYNPNDVKAISESKNYWTPYMKRLINKKYDFLIVQAAGNNTIDAKWSGFMCSIDDPEILNRVVVVGAVTNVVSDGIHQSYQKLSQSNYGSKLDIAAPGDFIFSCSQPYDTDPTYNAYYDEQFGTSMATPFVSGVAGMVWAAKPQLSAVQVKDIIVSTADRQINYIDTSGNTRFFAKMLNAKEAVKKAFSTHPDSKPAQRRYGVLTGRVTDAITNNGIENTKITVYNDGSGDYYYASTISSADGSYELILELGDYTVAVEKDGYLALSYKARIQEGVITYSPKLSAVPASYNGIGTVHGVIRNSLDGRGVEGLSINFRKGINVTDGPVVYTTTTQESGNYYVNMEAGNYTGEIYADGYITGYFYVFSIGGTAAYNQNGVVTPVLPDGTTSIVLTWGETPRDLDSHLVGPTESGSSFHVYYGNKTIRNNGELYAELDVDDTSSYGPETTTISKQMTGNYTFLVHDYTNRSKTSCTDLSNSCAEVKVLRGGTIIATFSVPANQGGTVWRVFEMDGDTIIPINEMYYTTSPGILRSTYTNGNSSECPENELFENLPEK